MPLFMAVAGWFFRYSVERRSLGSLTLSKLQTLFIPTAFWWLVCVLTVWLLACCSFPTDSLSCGCPWFLPSVIFCIILGTLCYYAGRLACATMEYMCAFLIAISLHFVPWWSYNVAFMFPFFYCGYLSCRFALAGKVPRWIFPLCLLAACGIWIYNDYMHHFHGWSVWNSGSYILGPQGWERHLTLILYRDFLGFLGSIGFAGSLYLVCNTFEIKRVLHANRVFSAFCSFIRELGVWSLSVYLVQSVVVENLLRCGFASLLSLGYANPFDECFILYRWVLVPLASLFMCWVVLQIIRLIARVPFLSKICTGK